MRVYLKEMREKKTLSQVSAAELVGVSQPYYCEMESGSRQKDMSYSMMVKLANAFNVHIQVIIDAESDYVKALTQKQSSA